jgi:hypothetical protein
VRLGVGVVSFDGAPSFRFRLFQATREESSHSSYR